MVLVVPKARLLFAHVPKAGGSAVTAALRPYINTMNRRPRLPVDARGWQTEWHGQGGMHAPWVKACRYIRPYLREGWRYSAVHRNPWARTASMWWIAERPRSKRTLADYAMNPPERDRHALRQALDVAGPEVTDWLRFTFLGEDFRALCMDCGLPPLDLPPANVTKNRPESYAALWDDCPPAAIDAVRSRFPDDCERFGYEGPAS